MLPHTSSVCLWLWRSCWRLPMFVYHEYMCMSVYPRCTCVYPRCTSVSMRISVWFQDVYLYKSMCTPVCIPKIYLCVCVQVYPNLCVWVYQRCVCVLVCLFIRNFFLVHWADFVSDLSDQMLSGFFVHLFLASYVF